MGRQGITLSNLRKNSRVLKNDDNEFHQVDMDFLWMFLWLTKAPVHINRPTHLEPKAKDIAVGTASIITSIAQRSEIWLAVNNVTNLLTPVIIAVTEVVKNGLEAR